MEFDGDNAIEIALLGRNALENPQLHRMSTIAYSFLNVPEVLRSATDSQGVRGKGSHGFVRF